MCQISKFEMSLKALIESAREWIGRCGGRRRGGCDFSYRVEVGGGIFVEDEVRDAMWTAFFVD